MIFRVTEKLLNMCPEFINVQKNDGYSALHLASLNGHQKIIECLIRAKADLEMRTNRNQTALLLAIAKFCIPIIELLVENCKFFVKFKIWKNVLKKNL